MPTGKPKITQEALQRVEEAIDAGDVEASQAVPSIMEASKVTKRNRDWFSDRDWLGPLIKDGDLTWGDLVDRLKMDLAEGTGAALQIVDGARKRARSAGRAEVQAELDSKDQQLQALEAEQVIAGQQRAMDGHVADIQTEMESKDAEIDRLRKVIDDLCTRDVKRQETINHLLQAVQSSTLAGT